MFNSIFSENGLDDRFTYLKIAAESAEEAISLFRVLNIKGMNVTAPFKKEIMNFVDEIDNSGEEIDGINTIVCDEKSDNLTGYNTDYIGVSESLRMNDIDVSEKKIVVIGAGGASKAAVFALQNISNQTPSSITIVNRTLEKAIEISDKFNCSCADLGSLKNILEDTDIIISTLPADLDVVEENWLKKEHVVFDANYKSSKLVLKAEKKGCKTIIRGEEWLLNQAVPAYKHFTKLETPDRNIMSEVLGKDVFEGRKKIITLIGSMGSGKSCIGKLLSEKLGWNFIDLDEEIEKVNGKSIPEIFETEGEGFFRKSEKEVLKNSVDRVKSEGNAIISTGGGIVLDGENRELLRKNSICIWLYASPEKSLDRMEIVGRPLLARQENPLKSSTEIFNERKFLYAQTADIVVNNETKPSGEVAGKILDEIDRIL
jgi:shikimate dehydrogenase